MNGSGSPVYPNAVTVPVLALIAIIIDTPPFCWHVRNRNLAASSLVLWVIISNLMNFVNPLIWPTDDILNWWQGEVFCDIEIKFTMAANFGVIGSMACIMRNLAQVLDTNRTVLIPSKARQRRKVIIDCLFCFGGSVYVMAVHYIVQPSRYYIFAISGCTPSFDNSWPKLVIVFIWPPIICLVVIYYSILVVARMRRYRKDFSAILVSSNSDLTKSRFLRLFLLSIALILTFLPVQLYTLYQNSIMPLIPYSWRLVHGQDWWRVIPVPTGGAVPFDRWIQIAVGFAVFVFFGLGQDAQKMYRQWLLKIGFGRLLPCLRHEPSSARRAFPASSQTDSFGSKANLFFRDGLSRVSMLSSHSRDHISASTTTLSPVEPQKGFDHLSTIKESDPRASDTLSAPTNNTNEQETASVPARSTDSWLTNFLVCTHLSATSRYLESSSNELTLTGVHDGSPDAYRATATKEHMRC